ncbi:BtrH N-terminal domain-containing protein [Thomasclavelia sp.]
MKKIINSFLPQGGKHCITNSLKQIFNFYNITISEEMLFGIASGLSFLYINQTNSPMITGRTKVFEFENKIAQRLNITIKCKSGKDYSKIHQKTKKLINQDNPILIYVDMPFLNYLGLDKNNHFGGHAVVLFGYDDETKQYYLSDRDNYDFSIKVPYGWISDDYHIVSYDEIEKARSSSYRPFPANNKYLIFDFNGYRKIDQNIILEAVHETCLTMLNPPAQLLGINGILKFSKEILKWDKFSPSKIRLAGITNYFQISKDGGTGGGIFRKMYGEFLIESAAIVDDKRFVIIGKEFINISQSWDMIADYLWQLSLDGDIERLKQISNLILEIYEKEKNLYLKLEKIIQSKI